MKSDAVSDKAAGVYQVTAQELWHADRSAGPVRLKVTSDSMRPLLRAGDVVVVQPANLPAVQPGDIIVVQRGGEWITHRLVAADEHGFQTLGDNTRFADEAMSADQLVGRVLAIERTVGIIDLQQPRWRTINRRINRVQRFQLRTLTAARTLGGTHSTGLTRGLAVFINWPFRLLVRMLVRS